MECVFSTIYMNIKKIILCKKREDNFSKTLIYYFEKEIVWKFRLNKLYIIFGIWEKKKSNNCTFLDPLKH